MTCCNENNVLKHYVGESKTYYAALKEFCKGRLLTAVVSVEASDAALSITNPQLITVDTSDYDGSGNPITIDAYTGVSFTMSGGTAGSEDDEFTGNFIITVTTSAGTEIEKTLLFKVL